MNEQTLFLAWQDKRMTHQWFPVGRLDIGTEGKFYRFRYIRGTDLAKKRAGFVPLIDFPELGRSYESCTLFPLFRNRIMQAHRPDFREYLRMLDLPESANTADMLKISGGYRATDNFEVFPMLERKPDGSFDSRFFLHGWRYLNADAQNRILRLQPSENLYVTIELTNPVMRLAVQIQTEDYYMIGWAPPVSCKRPRPGHCEFAERVQGKGDPSQSRARPLSATSPNRVDGPMARLSTDVIRRLRTTGCLITSPIPLERRSALAGAGRHNRQY